MPLRSGHDQATIGHNIETLRREGYPEDQAQAIAYREARKSGEPMTAEQEVLIPRRLSNGQRYPSDKAHARALSLALVEGRTADAEHQARELAGLRGHPRSWRALYDATADKLGGGHGGEGSTGGGNPGHNPGHHGAHSTSLASPEGSGFLVNFVDAHPTLVSTVSFGGGLLGGLRMNAAYPEGVTVPVPLVGPVTWEASSWAAWGTLGLAALAKYKKHRRKARVLAGASVGLATATGVTRVSKSAGGAGSHGSGSSSPST